MHFHRSVSVVLEVRSLLKQPELLDVGVPVLEFELAAHWIVALVSVPVPAREQASQERFRLGGLLLERRSRPRRVLHIFSFDFFEPI